MRLLRTAFWTAAVIDALAALQLLLPTSFTVLGFAGLREPGPAGGLAVEAAVLMLGFTAVLVWGSRSPVERRGLLGVLVPLVPALALNNVRLGMTGAAPWSEILPILVIQAALVALISAALLRAPAVEP